MRNKLLYINTTQFGYHIDSFEHCKYLKKSFDVTYLCFDYGYEKIVMSDINILYVDWSGSYLRKGIRFLNYCLSTVKNMKIDFSFAVYFPMVSIFKLLSFNKNVILDIRTGSVNVSNKKIWLFNSIIFIESLFFNKVTIVSQSLALKLKLNPKKVFILPLGADEFSLKNKNYSKFHILYLGTLIGRRIHETVRGLKLFLDSSAMHGIEVTYDIFGDGRESDADLLNSTIRENGLDGIVMYHGRKTHSDILKYFDKCNIGVCYVPKTTYFDCQPSTKIYEYVRSGMVCIATDTSENKLLINNQNGVLCSDNPNSFSNALMEVFEMQSKWNSNEIRSTLKNNSWEAISIGLKNFILS